MLYENFVNTEVHESDYESKRNRALAAMEGRNSAF